MVGKQLWASGNATHCSKRNKGIMNSPGILDSLFGIVPCKRENMADLPRPGALEEATQKFSKAAFVLFCLASNMRLWFVVGVLVGLDRFASLGSLARPCFAFAGFFFEIGRCCIAGSLSWV